MTATKSAIFALSCIALISLQLPAICEGLSLKENRSSSRRQAVGSILGGGAAVFASALFPVNANAMDTTDVDDFLRTGGVAMPMGVSGQAGKSKPETGVLIREGTEISRDSKSGNVLAEILVKQKGSSNGDLMAVVTSFQSPWSLATGAVYDVECRDTKTGDGAFLAVSPSLSGGSLADAKDQFLIKSLFGPRGRFSFYGQPTDVKVKKSTLSADGSYKILDVNFSTLSQATQSEVPRKSRIIATLPKGSDQVVMLVGSSSATRWSKGSEKTVGAAVDSFRATAAPQTNLKLRAVSKDRFEL
uniref:PsbP C-terminal domain-containing protein n=1 Tax=Pseudo-nitzschia australis TaxID=44445 RepID=A0A7S4EQN6_9STRA|eukprot:CAMPEP_0168186436 /NCGR_PEP_ID=MMETSP0139_2-20121125/14427_1 /TAXON_ID=44445 /ORGANISM="Pseudo-nitzschia australis, Strain 10249 10 AB" /LENGTH=301 /DNA_ID=CAMNT_0008108435 /DNA_START=58 /DNA_END=963 /DNA_ORIENTATION=+